MRAAAASTAPTRTTCSSASRPAHARRCRSAPSTRPASRSRGMWFFTTKTVETIAGIFQAEKRKEVSGVVGSYEVTRQTIELELRARALPARDHLAVARRHQPVPVPAARRRPHLLGAGREGPRPRDPVRVMERAGFVGFVLVIALFMIGFTNDIGRLTGRRLRGPVVSRMMTVAGSDSGATRGATRTIAEAFRITAEDHPDRVAVRTKDDEVSLTWGELRDRVDALAGGLAKLGVRARRQRRADAQQPAGVPHRRPRGDDARRDAVLDLRHVLARADRLRRRRRRGEGRADRARSSPSRFTARADLPDARARARARGRLARGRRDFDAEPHWRAVEPDDIDADLHVRHHRAAEGRPALHRNLDGRGAVDRGADPVPRRREA